MTTITPQWPAERVAELRERWKRGETGGQIAAAMGMSRDAAIGKARRLGLENRPSSIGPRPRKPRVRRPKVKKPMTRRKRAFVLPEPKPGTRNRGGLKGAMGHRANAKRDLAANVTDGARTCQWPMDPWVKPYRFCGARSMPGRPYCEAHERRAHSSTEPAEP